MFIGSFCPECGNRISDEMIKVNMCWNCGIILDEAEADSAIETQKTNIQTLENDDLKAVDRYEEATGSNIKCERILGAFENANENRIETPTKIFSTLREENETFEESKRLAASNISERDNKIAQYDVVKIKKYQNGGSNSVALKEVLDRYAVQGWHLHTICSNQGGVLEDVLIFEKNV